MKKYLLGLASGIVLGMVLSSFCTGADNGLIIDVRTESEWKNGHIEGAILIPYDVIAEKIGSAAKDKTRKIYVYCRTGRRSKTAKNSLEKLGYQDVVDLGSLEDAAKSMKRRIVK